MSGNITRVVAIDPLRPEELRFGTSDLKRVEGIFLRVYYDGSSDKSAAATLTPAAYVFLASSSDRVQSVMLRHRREEKELRDRQYKELMALQREHGASHA